MSIRHRCSSRPTTSRVTRSLPTTADRTARCTRPVRSRPAARAARSPERSSTSSPRRVPVREARHPVCPRSPGSTCVRLGEREADAPGDRRDVHDAPVTIREHLRQEQPGQLDRRQEIDADQRLDLDARQRVEPPLILKRRIVDQYVDASEFAARHVDDPLRRVRLTETNLATGLLVVPYERVTCVPSGSGNCCSSPHRQRSRWPHPALTGSGSHHGDGAC
jgi:hypothetical protein